MTAYLPEFLTVAVLHALAVVSPGPDFAVVLRQSLRHGRTAGWWTSVGIGCGLALHIAISLVGLGLFLKGSATALVVVKWLGACYLAWIGVQALRAQRRDGDIELIAAAVARPSWAAWLNGFLVNVLNPKAALFFLSLFPLAVDAATPKGMQVIYGIWMILTTIAWFAFVATVFTRAEVRQAFLRHGHWIDRGLGVVFLGFAVSLAFASFS